MHRTPELWPADVYLEGADQYRGWFQSSLLTSVGALDQGAPFKQVLTHGWVVDGQGRAMHKSLGNGVDPADLIKDFGADIVRLWAASSDYHADVRCSKEIFKQIAQNYLKFRNTARYCLGNLADFDPNTDMVAPEQLEELDKWALTKLGELTAAIRKAYNGYEFHVVTHIINDFCVVELSSFYLDILKDRLYCEEATGLRRRSAQTALYLIVDAMAKLFAPILAFTCDEIWQSMPHLESDDKRNILLNQMPENFESYCLDAAAMEKWTTVMKLRQDVNGVLEKARADKRIGKALEAHVTLQGEDALKETCNGLNLAELCIVSAVDWSDPEEGAEVGQGVNFPGLTVGVSEAKGTKCPRCWMHSFSSHEDGLCARCAGVVAKLDVEV
jgi:isoleucyl-tRNA synthetase